MTDAHIAVLGAGVVGLTTALELQTQFRNAKITILADKFKKSTTSSAAAGLFEPTSEFDGPNEAVTRTWINNSYYHWNNINRSSEASIAGVTEISGYVFSNISRSMVQNPYLESLVPLYRTATTEELNLCPGGYKYGSFLTTLLIDQDIYLPWATNKILETNGDIISQTVGSFSELVGKYDVVVNCTGLGAQYLCNDKKVRPIRGQVLKVHAPWIKTFFYGDNNTYIIPSFGPVTLGGCRDYNSYNLSPYKYDTLAIRERCEEMLPSLKSAPLVEQRVGLRPYRHEVRVEKELIRTPNGQLKLVHNYGHGAYGVSTSPGTAKHAVELVKEILMGNSKL